MLERKETSQKNAQVVLLKQTKQRQSNESLSNLLSLSGNGTPLNAIDTSRFRLEPPSNPHSEEDWKAAVDNAHAQIEHQQNRLVNLELINKFGANAWKLHNFQLEAGIAQQKQELLDLNKERKIEQTRAGGELRQLEEKWSDLVDRVLRVDIANQVLEAEIEALQQQQQQR
ncbi:Pre-mRNA-splicing factor SPF27 [Obelidium mucronatum]|nr:Pre-mRNA-splicing factor SPF27 [Obelidium mucronatum]